MTTLDRMIVALWRAGVPVAEPPSLADVLQAERYALAPRAQWTAGHAKAHPRAGTGKFRQKIKSEHGHKGLFDEQKHPREPAGREGGGQFTAKQHEDTGHVTGDDPGRSEASPKPFAASAHATETEAFKTWFGNSKVVNEDGKPLVVYHGTDAVFSEFYPFSHFGTVSAAEDRIRKGGRGDWLSDAAIMPVYLSIQNPLRIQDFGRQHSSDDFLQAIELAGGITRTERERIEATPGKMGAWKNTFQEVMDQKGIDGLVYANRGEDEGSTAFVAFRPNQIKSATGNRGTFDPETANIHYSLASAFRHEFGRRIAVDRYRANKPGGFWSEFSRGFGEGAAGRFEEAKHPRGGKGTTKGGKFVAKGAGGGGSAESEEPATPQPQGTPRTVDMGGKRWEVIKDGDDWYARPAGTKKTGWERMDKTGASGVEDEIARQHFDEQRRAFAKARWRHEQHKRHILDVLKAGPQNGNKLWRSMGIPKDDFLDAYFALHDAGAIQQDPETGVLSLVPKPAKTPTGRGSSRRPEPGVSPITGEPLKKGSAMSQAAPIVHKPQRTPEEERAARAAKEKADQERKAREQASQAEARKAERQENTKRLTQTAEDWGLSPDDLMDAAKFVHGERRKLEIERERLKQHAREVTHLDAGNIRRMENQHRDYTALPGFDEQAQEIARNYPGVIGDPDDPNADFSRGLWDLLREGSQQPSSLYDQDVLNEAAQYVRIHQQPQRQPGDDEGEMVPAGDLEEVPFAMPGTPERYSRYCQWRKDTSLVRAFRAEFATRDHAATVQRYAAIFLAYYAKAQNQRSFVWTDEDEAKHPRDADGQFTEKAGGAAAKKVEDPSETERKRYEDYKGSIGSLTPRPLDEWLKTYREAQARQKTAAEPKPHTEPEKPPEPPAPKEIAVPKEPAMQMVREAIHGIPMSEVRKRLVEDFGERIGGARKEMAKPLGQRAKKDRTDDTRPAWARRYLLGQIAASKNPEDVGKWQIHDEKKTDWMGNPRQIGGLFATREEAEAAIPLAEAARTHGVTLDRKATAAERTWAIVRKVSDRKRPVVKGGFASQEAAMYYLAAHPVEIIEHKFPTYETYQYLDSVTRQGGRQRQGDVSPKDFHKEFGFRGGEFGNWQSGKDGQTALNHAYDAMHDLADILNLPPKGVTLNGQLSIAFGARGHGGKDAARAHYEPDKAVINLTKMKGAGSLAHEWAHALDDYFARVTTGKDVGGEHVSHGLPYKHSLRPEVATAWTNVVNAMTAKHAEVDAQPELELKRQQKARTHVAERLAEIEKGLLPTSYRKTKPFTPQQQKEWDDAKQQILAGDVGPSTFVYKKSVAGLSGYDTYAPLQKLNELYKHATGRSFHTSDHSSPGNGLFWSISSTIDAEKRVQRAQEGIKETRKTTTEYFRKAREMDETRTSDYYALPEEMLARAFEAYVEDKLHDQSRKSEYLAAKADNAYYRAFGLYPFPEGDERNAINAAFDELFAAIKQEERQDDKGTHVRLYSAPLATDVDRVIARYRQNVERDRQRHEVPVLFAQRYSWNEQDHPRGQPENAGEFARKRSGGIVEGMGHSHRKHGTAFDIAVLSSDPESGGRPLYRGTREGSHSTSYSFWTPEKDYAEAYLNIGKAGRLEKAYLTDESELLDITTMIQDGYVNGADLDAAVPGLADALGIDNETEIEAERLWDTAGEDLSGAVSLLKKSGYKGFRWLESNKNEAYLLIHGV